MLFSTFTVTFCSNIIHFPSMCVFKLSAFDCESELHCHCHELSMLKRSTWNCAQIAFNGRKKSQDGRERERKKNAMECDLNEFGWIEMFQSSLIIYQVERKLSHILICTKHKHTHINLYRCRCRPQPPSSSLACMQAFEYESRDLLYPKHANIIIHIRSRKVPFQANWLRKILHT